jgi:hypothetical protein
MRKRLFAICLVLVLLVAATGLSCEPAEEGTIEVKATIDGSPWTGALDYTLTPASGSPISGTDVPGSHSADAGTWTCSYDSGGPDGATLVGIATSETQELSDGGTITFTLNFEIPETDASVTWLSWTIDGAEVPDGSYTVHPPTIIDAEYDVFVAGNSSEWVTVNQTFNIMYHFKGQADSKTLHVANEPGCVYTDPPAQNLTHEASVDGICHPACYSFTVYKCEPVKLDMKTSMRIRKGTHHKTTINWLGIPSPSPILFDIVDILGSGNFTVYTWACITVEGDVDPTNDCSADSPMLYIEYKP